MNAAQPDTAQFDLQCSAEAITIQAAEGDIESVPRFSMVAYTGGPMRVQGLRQPVVVDFEGLIIPSQRRPVRFAHSMHAGVGHTERIAVENGQLVAEGVISRDTPAAREIVASGKRGFPWQASIGAGAQQLEFIRANKSVTVNDRTFDGPLYVARRTLLGEISFVDLGADGNTSAQIAAQQTGDQVMDDTTDTNVTPEQDQEQETATATETETTVEASATAPDTDLQAAREAEAADLRRRAAIRKVCGEQHAEIAARAIEENWSPEKAELEVLRASRPKAPAVHVPDTTVNATVLEAACFLSGGLQNVEELHAEQTLEAAERRFRGGIGLQELLLEAAWANGYTGRSFRQHREILRYAFGHQVEAGFSTVDVGGILSNVTNKFLLAGFMSVERTWRNICAIRPVSDFKAVTSYRLVGKDQYEKVGPGGELKHGALGEESYSNQADTYGLMLAIDRRDIINDDLGAISTVPRKLGRGSGLKINDVVWTEFLNNAAFFKADNKNYLEGADTALGIDGLTKAEVAFMNQTDADGKPIGAVPVILLVPPALSALATTLNKSLEIRDTTASTKYPVANPHTGKFRAEVSRYLSNPHYTGYSEKAWYLLAEPEDLAVIEVAFLNGQESPTIETADADFSVLGIQMRGYHDFGAALQEPRAGVRSKGEA